LKDGNGSEMEVVEEEAFLTNVLGPLNLQNFIEIQIPASP